MALLTVIRIFVFSVFFNVILPSSDVYSDILLMFQTWTFQNTDSLEMSGCRVCYGKYEQDLFPKSHDCQTCVTKSSYNSCGGYVSAINQLKEIESYNVCQNKEWGVTPYGILDEGECHQDHWCCFQTKVEYSNTNKKIETKTVKLHPYILIDCNTSKF